MFAFHQKAVLSVLPSLQTSLPPTRPSISLQIDNMRDEFIATQKVLDERQDKELDEMRATIIFLQGQMAQMQQQVYAGVEGGGGEAAQSAAGGVGGGGVGGSGDTGFSPTRTDSDVIQPSGNGAEQKDATLYTNPGIPLLSLLTGPAATQPSVANPVFSPPESGSTEAIVAALASQGNAVEFGEADANRNDPTSSGQNPAYSNSLDRLDNAGLAGDKQFPVASIAGCDRTISSSVYVALVISFTSLLLCTHITSLYFLTFLSDPHSLLFWGSLLGCPRLQMGSRGTSFKGRRCKARDYA